MRVLLRYTSLIVFSFFSVIGMAQSVKALPDHALASDSDRMYIRRVYAIAENAVAHGNHPFGALLVHNGVVVAEFENAVVTTGNITQHAETGLIGYASAKFSKDVLAACILYTSTEPCIMCCGAIYWAGIGKVVFGVSEQQMDKQINSLSSGYRIESSELFQRIKPSMVLVGPVLEKQGLDMHAGFWPAYMKKHGRE